MDNREWEALFANLAADDSSAPAESNAAVPTQDEYLAIDTDSEDRVSVAPSIYSLTSSLRAQSLRQVHGRSLNAHSDIYHLPADEEEATRLSLQHQITYLIARSDHYYGISEQVREVLAPNPERQRKVADLGCGPGSWTLQCAIDFPHAEVLGIDLAPTIPTDPPPNCRFEIDDLNLGLEHFYGSSFDLIHARLVNSGIKDYAGLVDQVSRCLHPGGMAIFVESDFRIWSEDERILIPPNFYTPLPGQGKSSLGVGATGRSAATRGGRVPTVQTNWAVPAWMAMLSKCMRAQGGNVDAATLLKTWMSEHPNYVDVQAIDLWPPLGPWSATKPNDWTRHPNFIPAAEMAREDVINLMKSARPLLYQWLSEPEVAELEGKAVRELKSAANPMYVRLHVTAGYRR